MKSALKKILSKRAILIVLVAVLVISIFNTYLILDGIRTSNSSNILAYDFVLSQDGQVYQLRNMYNGQITTYSGSASSAINSALSQGDSIYLNYGTYILTEDVEVINKLNCKIVSDGATIIGNGHKILLYGEDYTFSQNGIISGLTIINGTIKIQNSLSTSISNIKFVNTTTGIEFINTNTWSEYNKIENCQFINNTEGIAFRTPVGENATGSYASSIIERCSFNINDFSVGIKVEPLAEFSDSQLQNVRFWMGEHGRANQTALLVRGTMCQSLLLGVVFESFTDEPVYMFGIELGETCTAAPLLDGGVSFLGNWTAKIYNPYSIWISGVGSLFSREKVDIPVGTGNQYNEPVSIDVQPSNVAYFKPKIEVTGGFKTGEIVTVRIWIEYIDNTESTQAVVRTFNESGSVWLSDEEMLSLYPSQNIVWSVKVAAKTNMDSSGVYVKVSGYGATG